MIIHLKKLCMLAMVVMGLMAYLSGFAVAEESVGQLRVAFLELSRLQALSTPGTSYQEYRQAVSQARLGVSLLRDETDKSGIFMRRALAYHEKALAVWKLQADSPAPVDSLRDDEEVGASIRAECPDVPRFHYKWRDQIYVRDAVACLWGKAAVQLKGVPAVLR